MNAIRFHVEIGPDGVIRPPSAVRLPVGQAEIIVLSEPVPASVQPSKPKEHLFDKLDRIAAKLEAVGDLPTDLALNHDHYLHGLPKRTGTE